MDRTERFCHHQRGTEFVRQVSRSWVGRRVDREWPHTERHPLNLQCTVDSREQAMWGHEDRLNGLCKSILQAVGVAKSQHERRWYGRATTVWRHAPGGVLVLSLGKGSSRAPPFTPLPPSRSLAGDLYARLPSGRPQTKHTRRYRPAAAQGRRARAKLIGAHHRGPKRRRPSPCRRSTAG
jgi:hypothetical protein